MIEILIAPICLVIDQITKKKAVEKGPHPEQNTCLKGKVHLGLVYNKGAMLGILGSHRKLLMLANIGSMVVLLIAIVSLFFTRGNHIVKLSISFMTGGALGNMFDRITRKQVVDFFSFKWKSNIYFNLADMFVFLGGLLLLVGSLLESKK